MQLATVRLPRRAPLRLLFLVLAILHLFPAWNHIAQFVASPSWQDAWKGFGALFASAIFVLPLRLQVRLLRWIGQGDRSSVDGRIVRPIVYASLGLIGTAMVWAGCSANQLTPNMDAGGIGDASVSAACPPCVTDQDCAGGTCAQLAGDSYCTPSCPNGNECSTDRSCVSASSVTGQQVSVCVPRSDVCTPTNATDDAGTPSGPCGSLVGPDVKSGCTGCGSRPTCQANGCYGGWWCNTATNKCQSPPSDCTSPADPFDAGPAVTGQVNANGGALSRLLFAVVGDTRPASVEDTTGYPTAVINTIYSNIEAFSPRPAFVVSTGDYIFASANGSQAAPQLDLYLQARGHYSGAFFPALGNHECNGFTNSNCGHGNETGITKNYSSFLEKMLGPIQKTEPYYAINIDAADKSWTSKFVFVAANAWTSAQESWLTSTLAKSTTYTFIVRHEPKAADTAPGVKPSEQIMAQYPYTLCIVGHTHTYEHYYGREVVIGNGGAPLTGSKNYGFGLFSQRSDGAIQVDMVDYSTGATNGRFRFAVKPDGSVAP